MINKTNIYKPGPGGEAYLHRPDKADRTRKNPKSKREF